MLSKIAAVTFISAVAAQYGDTTTTTTQAAVGNGYAPGAVTTTVAVDAKPAVYYYADYDNIVAVSDAGIYYQSALTPEAVERTKQGDAAAWSAPVKAANPGFADAKGVAFCGAKGEKMDNMWGGKFKQVFVADAGEMGKYNGAVYGWDVLEDPMNPAAIKLGPKWTVYQPADGASPVDVECGPKNGLFIADQYNNAVNWVTYDNLVAKNKNKYAAVVPVECGAAVGDVRSLAYNAKEEVLVWSNNAPAPNDAGVFQINVPNNESPAKVVCDMAMCAAGWSPECSGKVKQVEKGEMGKQVWAVADAWNKVEVSKGDAKIYDGKEIVAEVAQQATYADAAEDPKRDVLVVADEKAGEVSVVPNGKDAKKVGAVADVYGVAYNNGYGWNGVEKASASTVALAAGALMAALALVL